MPSEVMMTLGDFRFCLDTAAYERFRRSTEWRWPSQDRIRNAPALQYVGPGADTIDLEGIVYPIFRGGLGQIDAMRKEADKGVPLLMTDGRGFIHGYWAILRIEEEPAVFFENGTPKKQDFRISLQRYNDPVKAAK